MAWVRERTTPTDPRLSENLILIFANKWEWRSLLRGSPTAVISILDRSRYFSFTMKNMFIGIE
jgi:hypothetical protein